MPRQVLKIQLLYTPLFRVARTPILWLATRKALV